MSPLTSPSPPPPSFPFHIKHHIIDAAHIREYPRATANSQDETLKLHVNEYIPKDNPNPRKGDVTIIGGHANGFPKVRHSHSLTAHHIANSPRNSMNPYGKTFTARQRPATSPSGASLLLMPPGKARAGS